MDRLGVHPGATDRSVAEHAIEVIQILLGPGAAPEVPAGSVTLRIGKAEGVRSGQRAVVKRLNAMSAERGLAGCGLVFDSNAAEFLLEKRAPARLTTPAHKVQLLQQCGFARLYMCPLDKTLAPWLPQTFVQEMHIERIDIRWLLSDRTSASKLGERLTWRSSRAWAGLWHSKLLSPVSCRLPAAMSSGQAFNRPLRTVNRTWPGACLADQRLWSRVSTRRHRNLGLAWHAHGNTVCADQELL